MADQKPTENNSKMLGGVNNKASEYNLSKAEFLNIRNMDFDVSGALQKRPGSTQAIAAAVGGPIQALHEFVKLDGTSTIIAGTDTELRYLVGTSLTLLDTGWSNGQPPDMLTFVNKEWMANGSKFYGWSGVGATPLPAGLPIQNSFLLTTALGGGTAPAFSVFGYTMSAFSGVNSGSRVYLYGAYSYVRADGYQSPLNPAPLCVPLTPNQNPGSIDGSSYWSGATVGDYCTNLTLVINGFTTPPSGYGITALALYFLIDTGTGLSLMFSTATTKTNIAGTSLFPGPPRLNANIDPALFKFFTLVPFDSATIAIGGASGWINGVFGASQPPPFSLMTFGWFNSNTPKYIEINQNSMFYAGFSNAPSNVWFSELGSPERIEPENVFEVRTNDGDRVFAIKSYNNEVIVLKQNSFHKVIGDSPENFALIELSTEYGCISNQSVVEYREKLCWLDQKGIIQFNGASWDIISTQVEDIFRRMNLDAAKEKACAVHQLYRNQIWWGIPIDGATQNNLTVVYDYLVDAWTFFDGFNPASFALAKSSLTKPTVFRGDYAGVLHFHGESFFGDNGSAFTCIATPHWDKNKENETWIWRRAFLDVATVSGLTGQITGKVYSNYDLSTVQATFSTFQDAFQSRAEMGVVGKAVTAEFAHRSASLPLLINNYSWAKRFLRNV